VHNEKWRKDCRNDNGTREGYGNGGKHIKPGGRMKSSPRLGPLSG